jgi:hypothetical protein
MKFRGTYRYEEKKRYKEAKKDKAEEWHRSHIARLFTDARKRRAGPLKPKHVTKGFRG